MLNDNKQYDGPLLYISITEADEQKYRWQMMLKAEDYKGSKQLGYKASGLLADLTAIPDNFDLHLHDENRDQWTRVNPGERPKIRQRMQTLLGNAMKAMTEAGHT